MNDVTVSSKFTKKTLNLKKLIRKQIKKFNILCQNNIFSYLSNDDITWNHLVKDRTHSNNNGTHILAGSFVDFLAFISGV